MTTNEARVLPARRGDVRWWEHPDRKCKDDFRYTSLESVRSNVIKNRLAAACFSCPVFTECRADALTIPDVNFYGIQAGIIGKT